jgi:hypothetical protein
MNRFFHFVSRAVSRGGVRSFLRRPGLQAGILTTILACAGLAPAAFAQSTITIRNKSAYVASGDLALWAAAIDQQISADVAPVWGVSAHVAPEVTQATSTGLTTGNITGLPAGNIVCVLYDGDNPTTSTLGDHYIDKNGLPGCEINVAAAQYWGQSVSVVLSHEILEMLINPWLDGLVVVPAPRLNPGGNYLYIREICDPVEGFTYQVAGVPVSDFVYPQFWRTEVTAAQMDRLNLVHIALTPSAGFLSYRYTSGMGLSDWQTMYAPGFNLTNLFSGQ